MSLWTIERKGTEKVDPTYTEDNFLEKYIVCKEKWKTRPRCIDDEDEAMQRTILVAQEIIELIGVNEAAALILDVERAYWQSKNSAGQIQKNRQDRLGMGWANHDHHTFRSSRSHFQQLVRLFEMLGFHCRERYYAGQEAGWGAQIMENPISRLVLFLDVDLSPDEIDIDFAHKPLKKLDYLGTIGLWCALHGDSMLKGGMHHLEAQFMFDELTKNLGTKGVGMMEPFSNFNYLKQAFTVGERWSVDPKRVCKEEKDTKDLIKRM
jgi:hypothetical protein